MPVAPGLTNTLRRYGERSAKNKARLELWLDEAIENVGELKGGHLASASANGSSFLIGMPGTKSINMTNAEWASCLDVALQQIELGYKAGGGRSYGNIF